jgi:integrase
MCQRGDKPAGFGQSLKEEFSGLIPQAALIELTGKIQAKPVEPEFLGYSGCRKAEAARVEGRHFDFEKSEITVLGNPVTGTKNWEIRRVPMIPEMRRLLERIRGERGETEFVTNPVMPSRVSLWIHGHTHHNVDYKIGATRTFSNQRGYPDERLARFEPQKIIEIS